MPLYSSWREDLWTEVLHFVQEPKKTPPCIFYPFALFMPVAQAVIVSSTNSPVTAHLGECRSSQYFFADVLSFFNVSFWGFPGKKCHYTQEAFSDSPSTVQTDGLFPWEVESEYYPHFTQVEVDMQSR